MTQVTVVIPAYNAEAQLRRSLPALLAGGEEAQVRVVDAGSTDATAQVAAEFGVEVLQFERRTGPAEARNAGASGAEGDVLLFLDADCVPQASLIRRVREAFQRDPQLVSLCGSYDAHPPDFGFFSQYMNLRHHLTHQRARREGASFWAGCGAVRKAAFERAGGFDAARFPEPMIEDVELALRLAPLGRMRLDPTLQVTHLKRWTLISTIGTDVRRRAIPWSRLIAETERLPDDLNLRVRERFAAALAPFALLAAVGLPLALWFGIGPAAIGCAVVIGGSFALGAPVLYGFLRLRGVWFALRAWLFHQIHLTYSGITFAICMGLHRLRRRRARTR
ncbi:MAG: glycosyltransferase [Proteobacteria bacterium]|nr:glycosyltransferase [Pseudomonadota bacterium]